MIYATLGIAPATWNRINAMMEGQGVSLINLLYLFFIPFALGYQLVVRKDRSISGFVVLIFYRALFSVMYSFENNLGEKIHMAQYGVFGLLLYRALRIDFGFVEKKLYIWGGLICIVAGALNEYIQGILPNRFYQGAYEKFFKNIVTQKNNNVKVAKD